MALGCCSFPHLSPISPGPGPGHGRLSALQTQMLNPADPDTSWQQSLNGQGSLLCCSLWGRKELNKTE